MEQSRSVIAGDRPLAPDKATEYSLSCRHGLEGKPMIQKSGAGVDGTHTCVVLTAVLCIAPQESLALWQCAYRPAHTMREVDFIGPLSTNLGHS